MTPAPAPKFKIGDEVWILKAKKLGEILGIYNIGDLSIYKIDINDGTEYYVDEYGIEEP